MASHFTKDFFTANRAKLRQLFAGTAPIVITANGILQRSADTTFPFRQDSNFWYLTGIDQPDVVLVMDKDKEYLIVPDRSASRAAFDGMVDYKQLSEVSGIATVYGDTEGWDYLNKSIKKSPHIATLAAPKSYIAAHGMYTNPARKNLLTKLRSLNPGLDILDLRPHLVTMRMIKQAAELRAIEQAINVTADTLTQVKSQLKGFSYEYELEAAITHSFNSKGLGHAYAPIIASGINACTLHYMTNKAKLKKGELVLLDVGAEASLYAADITRTYSLDEPTKRQQQVWKAVIDVQEYSKQLLKPGADIRSYEKQVEAFMGEKLRELGLIKTISTENIRAYYPHATSHYLGLDVHDAADYERDFEPGMVLTVEPGIYISEESIGIRIEDNVVITDEGIRVLSEKLPREL